MPRLPSPNFVLLVTATLCALLPHLAAYPGAGFHMDQCRDSSECEGDFLCQRPPQGNTPSQDPIECVAPATLQTVDVCQCRPAAGTDPLSCTLSPDCPVGERCIARGAGVSGSDDVQCISCAFFEVLQTTDGMMPTDKATENCATPPAPTPNGLPADLCSPPSSSDAEAEAGTETRMDTDRETETDTGTPTETATDTDTGTETTADADPAPPCRPPYVCTERTDTNSTLCSPTSKQCSCVSIDAPSCSSSDNCPAGTRCAGAGSASLPIMRRECVSCVAVRQNRFLMATESILPEPASCTAPLPTATIPDTDVETNCPTTETSGLTLTACCNEKPSCAFPRNCMTTTSLNQSCAPREVGCLCAAPGARSCGGADGVVCANGEGCFAALDRPGICVDCRRAAAFEMSAVKDGKACPDSDAGTTGGGPGGETDEDAQASPEGSDGSTAGDNEQAEETPAPVCVDVALLAHLPRSALVFARHRRAAVLCDVHGTCATPGHMVVVPPGGRVSLFAGTMAMQTYCGRKDVFCTRETRWVNSPRWRAGLRVAGRGGGVVMTAHAARWESALEEWVLRLVVHVGL